MSITVDGTAVAGQPAKYTASGTAPFDWELFVFLQRVVGAARADGSGCAADAAAAKSGGAQQLDAQTGTAGSYSVPGTFTAPDSGSYRLCGYLYDQNDPVTAPPRTTTATSTSVASSAPAPTPTETSQPPADTSPKPSTETTASDLIVAALQHGPVVKGTVQNTLAGAQIKLVATFAGTLKKAKAAKRTEVGKAVINNAPAGAVGFKIKLNGKARQNLKSHGSMGVTVTATIRPQTGQPVKLVRKTKLKSH